MKTSEQGNRNDSSALAEKVIQLKNGECALLQLAKTGPQAARCIPGGAGELYV